MNALSTAETTQVAIKEIWRLLGPRGSVEGAFDAFRAGHMPEKGPFWYSATVFNGLSEEEIDALESRLPYPVPEQTQAKIPLPMREFLSVTNGLNLHNLSIYGQQGRIDQGAGAPFDLGVPQLGRPPNVPKNWFCIGGMNGPWASQGEIYLSTQNEVVLVHRDTGDVGARWPSFAAFLSSEIPRLLSIHDNKGDLLPGVSKLPGDTDNWEKLAERAKMAAKDNQGLLGRIAGWLRRMW
jgi:hypothetical protein